ncbi:ABC transporter ATP-binding protein [Paeniglutamicibacter sulfureus]|uniref:Iron(III) transport system ATP-binding protein n=1 Tax=Paeniglutamicibacter sulfureus TaxID=43666 RepID=A0ABU2BLI4_9MICC|nr:ABC transporter ATP-binding protein [Paeniglutamicibacter sulfureus]MDR7358829.1 iron(III) transport system ATP-binding protein [Paeniglutamicibacter sulfureus]
MATIEMTNLGHVYGDGHVGLEGIDLDVKNGEFLALLGPSGSGKTTLLRTIAGFIRPTAGNLAIGGSPMAGDGVWVPPEKRALGMVFQDHAIWPHLSVAGNVGYPLKLEGVPRPQLAKRVDAVLEQVGLAEYANRKPAALSGGQRQRVALARAIVAKPQALLLDEALSALDEPLRARLRLELRELTREEGLTAVHVTHDRAEALGLADRVAVLNQGKIQQIGTPRELLQTPANAFVASFVSDATLFPGTLVDGNFHADHPGFRLPVQHGLSRDGKTQMIGVRPAAGTRSRRAVAAVAPTAIRLDPEDKQTRAEARTGATLARVTSALYGRHGYETSLDWAGTRLRVLVHGWVPKEGELVRPVIEQAHVFCDEVDTAGEHAA